jgi:anthranilate synthase component II
LLLIIDNYDSFTHNLYQYIGEICHEVKVVRNDEITVNEIEDMGLQGLVLSPGPGRPENAGVCVEVLKELGSKIPILGICLGHQAIGYVYGGRIVGAAEIRHGKTSVIQHYGSKLFEGIKDPLNVMRYHSLIIDKNTVPEELLIIAETQDGTIMGIKHREYEVYGLQFHPESIMTECGKEIIKNFVGGICNATGSD